MICIHRTINRFIRSVANQRVIKIFPIVKRGWNVCTCARAARKFAPPFVHRRQRKLYENWRKHEQYRPILALQQTRLEEAQCPRRTRGACYPDVPRQPRWRSQTKILLQGDRVMRFTRVTGPAITITCGGCGQSAVAGDEPYTNSQGQERQPDECYTDGERIFDASCAAKLKDADPTTAVTRFYANTEGTPRHEHL